MLNQNYLSPVITVPTLNNGNPLASLTPENIELIVQLVQNMRFENVAKTSIQSAFLPTPNPSIDQPLLHYPPNVQYAAGGLETDTVESPTFSRLTNGKLLPKDYLCHLCFLQVNSYFQFDHWFRLLLPHLVFWFWFSLLLLKKKFFKTGPFHQGLSNGKYSHDFYFVPAWSSSDCRLKLKSLKFVLF